MDIKLLNKICTIPGAPGYEKPIRDFILKNLKGLVDEVSVDSMGNIIALKKASDEVKNPKKLMLAAHMDEISFIVTHIDENGFIRFQPLGGFDPKTLTAQRVIVHGKKDLIGVMGCKPVHLMSASERNQSVKLTDYFIDLGMSNKDVEKVIEIGNPITRERSFIEMGDCINGKSVDNRVSVFILIAYLKKLKACELDIYATFTVQEEVGIRGAAVATHQINPDFGINLDVTVANDIPGATDHQKVTSLGKGAAIKVLDGHTICDYRMVTMMKKVAKKEKIDFQLECLPAGGTDTAAVQRAGKNGSIAGGISIPTRYLHQVIESANKKDIQLCIDLLLASTYEIPKYNWKH